MIRYPFIVLLLLTALCTPPVLAGVTTRVSVGSDGTEANADCYRPSLSTDGRYVAFQSYASSLVPGDTNGRQDIFVRDRATGQTVRVSVASDGTQGNADSAYPSISADGRYIAFLSDASNLVPGDTNGAYDIFVHDRVTGQTERVSVASDGTPANASSDYRPSLSADGRYVAFLSAADNLVPGDTNGCADIFVRDRTAGQTVRVSVASGGGEANSYSYNAPSISADGRCVAFLSVASNLVAYDTNDWCDVFVHDRTTGQTTCVSVASDGTQANADSPDSPSLSADGRYVAFSSYASNLVPGDTNGAYDIFVHDRMTGQTERVSVASDGTQAAGASYYTPIISASGRQVVFLSDAGNLVPGDSNDRCDVFLHDRTTGDTVRVSIADNGLQGNADSYDPGLSGDGRCIAFVSDAGNLAYGDTNGCADVFVYDRVTAQTTMRVSVASDGTQANSVSGYLRISADGRFVAFDSTASNLVPGDTNGVQDIFVHDRLTGQTECVSIASDGTQTNTRCFDPSINANGRFVAFDSTASNLVPGDTNNCWDIFVRDRPIGRTERVSVASDGTQGNEASLGPNFSADGRYIGFHSFASNLVPGDTNNCWDIFVRDQLTGQTERVSVASDGTQANASSSDASISADGRYIAFDSEASNLVPRDTNNCWDIFVHDRATGQTERVSVASDGTQANADSADSPSLSADGRYVAFGSYASNLVPGDTNGAYDIFVHDRVTGQTERVSVASDGTQTNARSFRLCISADGRYIAFDSEASNLVPGDTNRVNDIFVHDRATGQTARVSMANDGTQANGDSGSPSLSADGRYMAFASTASNLVPGDTNGRTDIFVTERTRPVDGVALTSDQPSPQGSGRTITFTALPTGGANVEYQFWVRKCWEPYQMVQDYGDRDTYTWTTPSTPGKYAVLVYAREMGTTAAQSASLFFDVAPPISAVTLTSNPASPQLPGKTVTFTATPIGGSNVEYQFWVRKCWDPYQLVQDYSTQNTYTWTTPAADGKYAVLVYAREVGTTAAKSSSVFYTVAAPLSAVSLRASPASPLVGQSVTLTATPTGGAQVEYEFWVRKCWDPYARWQAFSTQSTTTWTPQAPGKYAVLVYARETGSTKTVSSFIYLTVSYPPVQTVTLAASPATSAPAGTAITLTAGVPGDTLPVEYEFWVRKCWDPYQRLQTYSTTNTATWRPDAPGTYIVLVYARHAGSTRNEASTFMQYTVTSP